MGNDYYRGPVSERVEFVHSSAAKLPFDDGSFDAGFTAGSLHEWSAPQKTFNEIGRVLKTGGRVLISDFRRDMFPLLKWFLYLNASLTSRLKAHKINSKKGLVFRIGRRRKSLV
jgi:ubiquinone/menaquinone biosynthesis C-methylase UbiE